MTSSEAIARAEKFYQEGIKAQKSVTLIMAEAILQSLREQKESLCKFLRTEGVGGVELPQRVACAELVELWWEENR